jgi:hypothetical protein
MMLWFCALLLSVVALATGCGSGDDGPDPLPRATTAEEWAGRVVNRVIRPMNRNIEVLATLNDPQTTFYIQTGNETTLRVLDRRLNDLARCNEKLDVIGNPPPTAERQALERVERLFRKACDHYEIVAEKVMVAVTLLGSGREEEVIRGNNELQEAAPEAAAGAKAYDEAVRSARRLPEFQAEGLQPPP